MIRTKLRVVTGLHIGDSDDTMKIGGIDSAVVKREIYANKDGSICYNAKYNEKGNLENNIKKIVEPYIPGSSIKGKIRSLLEHKFGLIEKQREIYENHKDKRKQKKVGQVIDSDFKNDLEDKLLKGKADLIIRLFGESAGSKSGDNLKITRAIFRDSFLTDESRRLYIDDKIKLSEEKAENTINRVTAMANPRFMERVPAGVEFDFEVILREFSEDKVLPLKETLELGLLLLQNDALGGGGSRGNGKINFKKYEDFVDLSEEINKRLKKIEKELKENQNGNSNS